MQANLILLIHCPDREGLVASVTSLIRKAHGNIVDLDQHVDAERVDSADVLARLADIGIQYAQGHFIGAPQPVEILDTLLKADPADFRLTA